MRVTFQPRNRVVGPSCVAGTHLSWNATGHKSKKAIQKEEPLPRQFHQKGAKCVLEDLVLQGISLCGEQACCLVPWNTMQHDTRTKRVEKESIPPRCAQNSTKGATRASMAASWANEALSMTSSCEEVEEDPLLDCRMVRGSSTVWHRRPTKPSSRLFSHSHERDSRI